MVLLLVAMANSEGFDFTRLCPFFADRDFALIALTFFEEFPSGSLLFSFPFVLITTFSLPPFFFFLSTSLLELRVQSSLNTPFRKSGSPISADSCFRNIAAPSRKA